MTICVYPTTHSVVKLGVVIAVWLSVLQLQRYNGRALLHSEVISCQASVVDVENQAGIVRGGIKHLQCLQKKHVI